MQIIFCVGIHLCMLLINTKVLCKFAVILIWLSIDIWLGFVSRLSNPLILIMPQELDNFDEILQA